MDATKFVLFIILFYKCVMKNVNVLWSGVSIRLNFMTYPYFHLFLVNCYSLTPKFSRRALLTCFAFARLVIDTPWSIGTTLAICYTQTRHSIGLDALKRFVTTSPAFRFRIPLRAIIDASCHESEITSQCYGFRHAKYHEIVASIYFTMLIFAIRIHQSRRHSL